MGLPGAGACTACPQHETTTITGATEPGQGSGSLRASTGSAKHARPVLSAMEGQHCRTQLKATGPPTGSNSGRECYECRTPDVLIAWLGPFLYPLLMIFGFLPPLIRSLRSMDMDHTKKARRLIRTEKHTSWLGRLAESDHGEFRMIIIMITCLQTLWIVSLMPLPYTRFTQDWLWALGIVAWDLSIFRPQCAFRLSYFMKWFLQWFTFFVMVAILAVLMLAYCHSHKMLWLQSGLWGGL
eukprot:s6365_g3.t1